MQVAFNNPMKIMLLKKFIAIAAIISACSCASNTNTNFSVADERNNPDISAKGASNEEFPITEDSFGNNTK